VYLIIGGAFLFVGNGRAIRAWERWREPYDEVDSFARGQIRTIRFFVPDQ